MFEQRFFDVESAAVSGQRFVTADDAMARNDERDGILPVGGTHSAGGFRVPDPCGEFAIADGFAVGNAQQFIPDKALESSAFRCERQVERLALSGKVLAHLFLQCF